jgi:hypothetical protein
VLVSDGPYAVIVLKEVRYLSFQTEYVPSVKLGFLEELSDEPLRRHLLNSVRLVNTIYDRVSRRVLRNSAPA